VANFTALFDACVLYPAPLRDLLLSVALTDQFRAKWSREIEDEWIRNLQLNRPDLDSTHLQRTVELMRQAVPDCLVENYEDLVPSLELPDENDRHVLAAAVKCQADVIVTFNLRDFPDQAVQPFEIDAQTPDIFLSHLFDLNIPSFCAAVREQRERLRHPPMTIDQLLDVFYRQGLPLTVGKLANVRELL
jgi:predicted nucleic acid-binding protein